ncbi:LCP family protein [Streptomyces sp. NPDC048442]|uniref:LCP family protein n=1 Tax=Streptomyces sp. NPDC048442 TaxID=3154823 RepID=UPI00342BC240
MPVPPRSPAPHPRDRRRRKPLPKERRRKQDERPHWGMRAATTVSVLVLAAGGIGHAMVTSMNTQIARVDPFKDMKNRPEAESGRGMNVLLVGTDGRDKITRAEKDKYRLGGAPCHCTDTVMLVHVSEDRNRASVVSLPRDSYAELPEHTDETTGDHHKPHPVKLNAAYAEGGPALTTRTVEHMTGVKIDHYLEVDFTSFMKTVDVLGGVDICTTTPLKDSYTGLDLAPGTHRLGGGEALQYVRSRHIDGASDLGRMQRQQRFLAAFIARATGSGALLNPVKFREVAGTLLGSVRADSGFGTTEMLALGQAMRGFTPASSEFTSVPIGKMSFQVKGIGSTLKWDAAKSKKLFQTLREDRPLAVQRPKRARGKPVEVSPEQIKVQVDNGTRGAGLGKRVDAALRATGFRTTGIPGNGVRRDLTRTLVTYDPRWDRSAQSLAAALPGCELKAVKGQGRTMRVTAGADYRAVTRVEAQDAYQGEFGVATGDQVVCP